MHQRLEQQLLKHPTSENLAYSTSHCPLASGFTIARRTGLRIGCDIEDVRRIRPAVIARVCSSEEVFEAPLAEALWVAKESAFKALSKDYGVRVLSELRIINWKVKDKKLNFDVRLSQRWAVGGKGLAWVEGYLILGIYVVKP